MLDELLILFRDHPNYAGIAIIFLLAWGFLRALQNSRQRVNLELDTALKLLALGEHESAHGRKLNPVVVLDAAELWFESSYGWLRAFPVIAWISLISSALGASFFFVLTVSLFLLPWPGMVLGLLSLCITLLLLVALIKNISATTVLRGADSPVKRIKEHLEQTLGHGLAALSPTIEDEEPATIANSRRATEEQEI